ncbi:MAG: MBG domain-containing protein [Bacteroidota bacterium]|nr:MBG domain-containing protein [Bacteroidota bacterium]
MTAQGINKAEYYFDNDPGVNNAIALSITEGTSIDEAFEISLNGLEIGFHNLFVRVRSENGVWSLTEGRTLFIQESFSGQEATAIQAAEYYFDIDPGFGQATPIDFASAPDIDTEIDIELADLSAGFHNLFVRVKDDRGSWSLAQGRTFYVQNTSLGLVSKEIVLAEYFIDSDPGFGLGTEIVLVAGEVVEVDFDIDPTGLNFGEHKLYLRVKDDLGRWSLLALADFTYVNKETQTITFNSITNLEYGDINLLDASSNAGTEITYESSDENIATISNGELTFTGVGEVEIRAIAAGNDNFLTTDKSQVVSSTKADLFITADDVEKTYGEPDPIFYVTSEGFKFDDSYDDLRAFVIVPDPPLGIISEQDNVGSYQITPRALSDNYNIIGIPGTYIIKPAELIVTAEDKSKVYGEVNPDLTIAYMGFVNGEEASTITEPSISTVADATSNVGDYDITLTGGSASNYTISLTDGTLTINERPITVTADSKTKVYGEADPNLTYQVTSGSLANSDQITGELSRTVGEDVGGYAINQNTLTAGTNYDLTYETDDLIITQATLTAMADDKGKTYGDANPTLTIAYDGFQNGDDETAITEPSINTVANGTSNVGDYDITLTGGSSDNYTINLTDGTLTINERPITVTADSKTKLYGEADPNLTYQVTSGSLANRDAITGELSRTAGEDVGDYAINQNTLTAGSNYDLTYETDRLMITQATLTATADDKSKTYGEGNPTLTITYNGFKYTDDESSITEPSISTAADATSGVGNYDITLSGGSSSNYSINLIDGALTVTHAALTATADDQSRTYGAENPELTITFNGFVNGDEPSDITLPTISTTADASSGVGTYVIGLNGGESNNYSLTLEDGTLVINKAALTVTADDATINKGDDIPEFTFQYEGFVNEEDESVLTAMAIASTSATSTSDRGTYDIEVSGAEADNYEIVTSNGTLTITGPIYSLPSSITFDALVLGDSQSEEVSINNTGDGALSVTGIALPAGYTVNTSSFTVNESETGSFSVTFTPTAAQIFAGDITITSNNGEETISVTGEGQIVTGIDDEKLDLDEVILYPNPSDQYLMIDLTSSPSVSANLKIVNVQGESAWQQKEVTVKEVMVTTSSINSGMYLLIVETDKGTVIKKVIIKH